MLLSRWAADERTVHVRRSTWSIPSMLSLMSPTRTHEEPFDHNVHHPLTALIVPSRYRYAYVDDVRARRRRAHRYRA